MGSPSQALRMLILTGQRRSEVGGMERPNSTDAGRMDHPCQQRPRTARLTAVDLSPQAIKQIDRRSIETMPDKPPVEPSYSAWPVGHHAGLEQGEEDSDAEVMTLAPAEGVEPPAARHSRSTPHSRQRGWLEWVLTHRWWTGMLNHVSGASGGLVGVYQRHEYRAERKAALDAWANKVRSRLLRLTANVVDLQAAKEASHD